MHNLVISFYLESKFLDSLIVLDEFIPNFHIIWMITFMVINFLLICQVKVMRAVFLNFTLLKSFYLALLLILVCFNRSIIRNKLLKWIVKCCLISHFFQLFIGKFRIFILRRPFIDHRRGKYFHIVRSKVKHRFWYQHFFNSPFSDFNRPDQRTLLFELLNCKMFIYITRNFLILRGEQSFLSVAFLQTSKIIWKGVHYFN